MHRGARLADSIKYWIKPDIENRIKEDAVAARFETARRAHRARGVHVVRPGGRGPLRADAVFLLTGYHPDVELLRGAGVRVDPETLKPALDPETLETNVPGLYVAGAVASGRETSRIFIENGRFHGEAIVASILARTGRGQGLSIDRNPVRGSVADSVHRLDDGPQPDVPEAHRVVVVLQRDGQLVGMGLVGRRAPCGSWGRPARRCAG